MKTIILFAVIISSLLQAAVTTTLESGYYTKYLAPAFGSPIYDDEVYQSQITSTVPWKHGVVGAAIWNSTSLNGMWDPGDETDLITFGTYKLGSGYEVRGSASYFLLADNEDTIRTTLGLFRTVDEWTFGVNMFNFANSGPMGDRWVGHLSVGRNFKISSKFQTVINSILVYDTGNNFTDNGFVFKQSLSLEYCFLEDYVVFGGATLFVPLTVDDVRDDADIMFTFGGKKKF